MKIKSNTFNYQDVKSFLDNRYINSLSCLEYGKAVQSAAEEYVTYNLNKFLGDELLIDVSKNPDLILEYNYSNNGPGFDRIYVVTKKRIQIKFRQVDGKEYYSRQIHFENTRRHSTKNKNSSAESGLVRYSVDEFDYVLVILCHIKNGIRTNCEDWSYSLISSSQLEDVNNKGYCVKHIPSSIIFENKCDNIYMLADKIKTI